MDAQASIDTLTVGYSRAAPFIIDDEGDKLIGVNVWLWEQIAKDLSITYRFQEMEFQEMLQGLQSQQVDISINPLTMTAERSSRFVFTSPYYVSNATIVMECSSRWETARRVIKTAFSRSFLEALVLLLLIVAFFGWLLWVFERKHNTEHFRSGISGVWDGFWWSSVTMTTVGYGDKKIKSLGGKIIALIWMFTALLFISGLTASIASTIMKDSSLDRVHDLNSLTNSNVGTLEGTSMEAYLQRRFFRKVTTFNTIESGLEAIENQEIDAFIYDEPILKYRLKGRAVENLEIMPVRFDQQLYAFGISKKHQDLEKLISERILYYTSTLEWKVLLGEYNINTD